MTTLTLTPFRDGLSLRDAMDQLFDQSFIRPWTFEGGYGLRVDVRASDDEYILSAAVPGLKPEDLHIEVIGDTVTVKGEIKQEVQNGDRTFLLQERRFGRFARSLTLPVPLNPAKAEAVIENGVLTLRLPKADEAKPKAISVKVKK